MTKPKGTNGGFAAKIRGITNRLLYDTMPEEPEVKRKEVRLPHRKAEQIDSSETRVNALLGFQQKLNQMLIRQTQLPIGQINLISLAQLRDQLGDRWPAFADNAHDVTINSLEKRTLAKDIFSRFSDLEYVVVCADMNTQAARAKCAAIANQIYREILGNELTEDVSIRITVERTADALVFADATMSEIIAEGEVEPPIEAEMPGGSKGPWMPTHAAEQKLEWPEAQTFSHINQSKEGSQKESGGLEGRPSWDAASVETIFRPIWSVQRGSVSSFYCMPCRLLSNGEILYGYDVLPDREDRAAMAWLDANCATQSLQTLHEMIANNFPLNIGISVAFDTLASSQHRARYLQLFRHITKPMQSRLLLEIREIPSGTPHGRLSELTNRLRPFSQAVFALTDLQKPNLEEFANTGITAVGVDLTNERRAEATIIDDLNHFTQMSERLALASYVRGARTTSLAVAAAAAGVKYVSGSRVGDDMTSPAASVRYTMEDFYARRAI